jgi:NitT/TauT family transport system substrate-binding protein
MIRLRLPPWGCRLAALKSEKVNAPMPRTSSIYRLAALAVFALSATMANAQTTIRIAKQFGISYLPLTVMEHKQLLEQQGKKRGLDLKVDWVQLVSGAPMNDAILSGSIDFASGGVGPLLTIWGKTRDNVGVKGVAALNSMPLYLNTINPNVKTLKDFTDKDRIALPAVKISIQAITLQMAAEKTFGRGQHAKLDALTVSLAHPDGMAAMLGGRSEITAHFTSAPFMYQELDDKRVEKILDSYQVLGGPHTFNVVWATTKFYNENRPAVEAFIAALDDAMRQIASDPAGAAALWVKAENSKLSPDYVSGLIRLPENEWTMVPKKIMAYAEFMNRAGVLPVKPASWKDIFFPDTHGLPGS